MVIREEYVSRVIVDVPQEKAKTYLCKLRIDKEMSERGWFLLIV